MSDGAILNAADLRFLRWLAGYCSPFGTEIARISVVSARLARRGFIARYERKVVLTGIGWQALIRNGYEPTTESGETLEQLLARRDEDTGADGRGRDK